MNHNQGQNYVDKAEVIIKNMNNDRKLISTSKIRDIFSMFYDVILSMRADSENTNLLEDKLLRIQVKLVYEQGKDKNVKTFIQRTHLVEELKKVKTMKDFEKLYQYLEALVAYHKYYSEVK